MRLDSVQSTVYSARSPCARPSGHPQSNELKVYGIPFLIEIVKPDFEFREKKGVGGEVKTYNPKAHPNPPSPWNPHTQLHMPVCTYVETGFEFPWICEDVVLATSIDGF